MRQSSRPDLDSTALGSVVEEGGVRFSVWSSTADALWVCIFDKDGRREVERHPLACENEVHTVFVPGLAEGARYGLRADGPFDPDYGYWFDPDKLLVDPYALAIDRPYAYDPELAAWRGAGGDTAGLVPKAIVCDPGIPMAKQPPLWEPGGLIYEVPVRAFTMHHPGVPRGQRGRLVALSSKEVVAHLKKLGVAAVELMPIAAWIDERHLPPLGLRNGWGYNPVTMMALDPRLAPRGLAELRQAVEVLHDAGIGVILDVVFNHTGESDRHGPTLSLRGLDSRAYYRHAGGVLVNDAGTGNTLACDHPAVRRLVLDAMRHFVRYAGVDGFRFDLAPILGRGEDGFRPEAELLTAMRADPELADRLLIAEPWDIGPGGYQLGRFPSPFLEWNDRYRDDVRRFWRGDAFTAGSLATRLAGSSDVFSGAATRTVNFIAAHDGMTLADLAAYAHKHNEANGEQNRDGHDENFSWNNGVEGPSTDPETIERRRRDVAALLSTLFVSRGAIMLTAGDESGRTQYGNNNAYAQDNETTWLDWEGRDTGLEEFVAQLSRLRRASPALRDVNFLTGHPGRHAFPDVEWLAEDGSALDEAAWNEGGRRCLAMILCDAESGRRIAVLVNGSEEERGFTLPEGFMGRIAAGWDARMEGGGAVVGRRSVAIFQEYETRQGNSE